MSTVVNLCCERTRGSVSLALDGELSQLERAMMERHLEKCDSCRAFRDTVSTFTERLRSAPLEPLERDVVVRTPRRARMTSFRFVSTSVGAAAATIALAVGVGLGATEGVDLTRSHAARSDRRPAYLDSPTYEQSLIRQQADRDNGTQTQIPV